jgi:hypothetical protein
VNDSSATIRWRCLSERSKRILADAGEPSWQVIPSPRTSADRRGHLRQREERAMLRLRRGGRGSGAIDGDLERGADLAHSRAAQSPETFDEDRDGDTLDRVEIHGAVTNDRVVVRVEPGLPDTACRPTGPACRRARTTRCPPSGSPCVPAQSCPTHPVNRARLGSRRRRTSQVARANNFGDPLRGGFRKQRVAFATSTALFVQYASHTSTEGAALPTSLRSAFCGRDERGMSACSTVARPTEQRRTTVGAGGLEPPTSCL